ncbi:MAG: hypothetical protein HY691_08840 [Chloroflexi bacterium]|nr:hypothetical protein [Chloroflexota bacterium]
MYRAHWAYGPLGSAQLAVCVPKCLTAIEWSSTSTCSSPSRSARQGRVMATRAAMAYEAELLAAP